MRVYLEQYSSHGLKKADMRKVWKNLFEQCQESTRMHHLSHLTSVGSGPATISEVHGTRSLGPVQHRQRTHADRQVLRV